MMISCFEEKDPELIASGEKALKEDADDMARLEWKKQAHMKRMMLGSVSPALAQRVMKKKTGTDMWKELLEYYEASSNQVLAVHKQRQLLHKLWHTRTGKGENMMFHIGKVMNIRDQLTVLKYPVHDVDMVDDLLNSLPQNDKYQQLAQMVRFGIGGQSKPEEIRDLILVAEAQLKGEAGDVFGARGLARGNGKVSSDKDQRVGSAKRCCPELESKPAAVSAMRVESNKNQQKQHSQNQQKTGSRSAKNQNVSCAVVPAPTAPVKSEVDVLPDHQELEDNYDSGLWHYDTASSAHIVCTMEYFVAYEAFNTVMDPCRGLAQNMLTHTIGVGVAELVTKSENGQLQRFTLDRVVYVPSARWNLFSEGIARGQGLTEVQCSGPTLAHYF
ncbi:hypothetical protein ON010_g4377 [Phytophthora cinnamomi]|nr:hypothetical protein ON010_g4377 [Phytophthora cinnamomi]